MRLRHCTNKGSFIVEDGKLIGVSTGFSYCAEHEVGIKPLYNKCGIIPLMKIVTGKNFFGFIKKKPKFGLERTLIINTEDVLQGTLEDDEGNTLYVFGYNIKKLPDNIGFKSDFEAYWHDSGFVIISSNKEYMTELVKSVKNKDLAFATGGRVLPDHAGIRMVIVSKASKELFDQCELDDRKFYEARKLDRKINIQKTLKKKGKKFYACSPYWKDYDNNELWWWLNPDTKEEEREAGYYTKDELIKWSKGISLKDIKNAR